MGSTHAKRQFFAVEIDNSTGKPSGRSIKIPPASTLEEAIDLMIRIFCGGNAERILGGTIIRKGKKVWRIEPERIKNRTPIPLGP